MSKKDVRAIPTNDDNDENYHFRELKVHLMKQEQIWRCRAEKTCKIYSAVEIERYRNSSAAQKLHDFMLRN